MAKNFETKNNSSNWALHLAEVVFFNPTHWFEPAPCEQTVREIGKRFFLLVAKKLLSDIYFLFLISTG